MICADSMIYASHGLGQVATLNKLFQKEDSIVHTSSQEKPKMFL